MERGSTVSSMLVPPLCRSNDLRAHWKVDPGSTLMSLDVFLRLDLHEAIMQSAEQPDLSDFSNFVQLLGNIQDN